MLRLSTFFFLLAMSATTLTSAQTPVHVAVYYESLCPDSIKFIKMQLYPTWEKLMKYMEVEFIPYGNSNTTKEEDGRYSFECQHGPAECYGNKVQACALGHLSLDDQKMKFINCVMSAKNTSAAGLECATDIQVSYKPIETCVASQEGNVALEKLGMKTKALSPPLKSVPTVVFNNKYMQDEQEKTMHDFKMALCAHITGTKPTECAAFKSGASQLAFVSPLFVLGVLAALLAR